MPAIAVKPAIAIVARNAAATVPKQPAKVISFADRRRLPRRAV